MEQKEFEESIVRITDTMKVSAPVIQDRIVEEDTSETQPYVVNATVVSIIVEPEEKALQVMQAILSEASNIAMMHENCKEVICMNDRMTLIYSTAYKEELNAALDDAARIRSLAMIVSKIGRQHGLNPITVNIGMDFGVVEMYKMKGNGKGMSRYAWRGVAIKNAIKNAMDAKDELIISRTVWNNLTENSQKLFERQSVVTENYRGRIINIMMNNWLTK